MRTGKTSAPDVFSSCSFIPRAHFESSSVMVSFYGKRKIVSHPYCPYLAESVMSLSCGIAASDTAKNSQKRNGEDHIIIIIIIIIIYNNKSHLCHLYHHHFCVVVLPPKLTAHAKLKS